jgi:hypothetical protein
MFQPQNGRKVLGGAPKQLSTVWQFLVQIFSTSAVQFTTVGALKELSLATGAGLTAAELENRH